MLPSNLLLLKHTKTNIYKSTTKDLNDLKIKMVHKMKAKKKSGLHNVFLHIEKSLSVLCYSYRP